MPMIIPSLGMIYVSLQQITGHDSAVLDSYVKFVGMTAKGLEIEMARRWSCDAQWCHIIVL